MTHSCPPLETLRERLKLPCLWWKGQPFYTYVIIQHVYLCLKKIWAFLAYDEVVLSFLPFILSWGLVQSSPLYSRTIHLVCLILCQSDSQFDFLFVICLKFLTGFLIYSKNKVHFGFFQNISTWIPPINNDKLAAVWSSSCSLSATFVFCF